MGKTSRETSVNHIIRPMTADDIDAVCEIEQASFSVPWSRDSFEREINENALAHYFVAEVDGRVIGYAGMWLIWDSANVTNVAVLGEYRGYGIGTALVKKMADVVKESGAQTLMLEVRRSNERAQSVYRNLGFTVCGVRKGYYEDNREDAILMDLDVTEERAEDE
ncbi:MAG: ribosomal protein S18-alanine N-acetyltransferase [Selenomonadales bacterium]|nr:ribosomal protein S18-alanine N-acetyltransferase [Selenomonadales bacterium]